MPLLLFSADAREPAEHIGQKKIEKSRPKIAEKSFQNGPKKDDSRSP